MRAASQPPSTAPTAQIARFTRRYAAGTVVDDRDPTGWGEPISAEATRVPTVTVAAMNPSPHTIAAMLRRRRIISAQHANHIRAGDDERLIRLEIADEHRGIFGSDHRREQLDRRGDVDERESRLHDELDRLRFHRRIGDEPGIEMALVERSDQ